MIDQNTEKCRACTVKHLSAALTALDDESELKGAYFCGNLVHAANHFMHYSQELANEMRQLRLSAQNESLSFILPTEEIRAKLAAIIKQVTEFVEPKNNPEVRIIPIQVSQPSSGCPCRNKK